MSENYFWWSPSLLARQTGRTIHSGGAATTKACVNDTEITDKLKPKFECLTPSFPKTALELIN